jgi:L-cysteine:1D-myo-inositol 2-amino-2-deoxy-alpha-D-glucopyranoside ligase
VTHKPFVKHWVHVGLVGLDGIKMSKSLGNLRFVSDLSEISEPAAVRVALLDRHYRTDWEWYDSLLERAQSRLATWRSASRSTRTGGVVDDVRAALDDDLNTPAALAALDEAALAGINVGPAAALLGITL